jgi:uncharacterized protein YecE (DUF72 family)
MSDPQLDFGWTDEPPAPTAEPAAPPRAAHLQRRLRELARHDIFVGTSSWKYPGWLGQVYTPARYQSRGRLAQKKFEQECLTEYASVFPTVCGDFAFYQFPTAELWERTFAQVPDDFRFSLKVPEDVTVQRFPDLPRYGHRAGAPNPDFMNAALVYDKLLARLAPYRQRLGVLIFEFGTLHEAPWCEPDAFAERLDAMLADLPTDRFRLAVEVRNPAFVAPPSAYWACLRRRGVAHCFNSWTRMPSIAEQARIPDAFTAGHVAARFLLRPGRSYQQAVDRFAPYNRVVEPDPEGRAALRGLIERCLTEQRTLFAFVNNRLEGNAIETIEAATESITAS